jgi:dihydroorotase
VTAETCPQYFIYTEQELLKKGTLARVNPPLRTEADRQAILEAVLDGTLDCIVTDHAPHSAEEKARPLPDAPSGMIGLETSLAACITYLVKPGHLTIPELIFKMSTAPARILGLQPNTLCVGASADLCVFDPDETWTVDPEQFRSKARNTIFAGEALTGKVKHTLCGGKVTFSA